MERSTSRSTVQQFYRTTTVRKYHIDVGDHSFAMLESVVDNLITE